MTLSLLRAVRRGIYASYACYALLVLIGIYRSGGFKFNDLALINDWMTNFVHRGQPFWITDEGFSHFQNHFTPTWYLLYPFYLLTDSQTLLLILSVPAAVVWVWFMEQTFRACLAARADQRGHDEAARFGSDALTIEWLSIVIVVLAFTNVFLSTILVSPNFQVFLMAPVMAVLYLLVRGPRRTTSARWILLMAGVALLAMGVHESVGFFLFFQVLAVALLPPTLLARAGASRRAAGVVAGLALLYTFIAVRVFMPIWSTEMSTREWSQWGDTWPGVFLNLITSPVAVAKSVGDGAFMPLNESVGLLNWLNPVAGAVTNLPGFFYYVAGHRDYRNLWYYNSTFLLPGIFLAVAAGIAWVWRLTDRWRHSPYRRWAFALTGVFFVWRGVSNLGAVHGDGRPFRITTDSAAIVAFTDAFTVVKRGCPAVRSLATDQYTIAFLPGYLERYMLRHADRADVVMLKSDASLYLADAETMDELQKRLAADPGLRPYADVAGYRILTRASACRP